MLLTQPNDNRCRCCRRIFGGLSPAMSMQMGVPDRQLHFIAAVAFCQRSKDPGAWSQALPSIDRSGGDLRKAPAAKCSLADLSWFRLGWALCEVTCVLRDILFLHHLEESVASARLRLESLIGLGL